MASVTKYPGTVSQTTGGHYVSWDNLENIKTAANNMHAVSNTFIQGKDESKNTPSPITGKGFQFNLPEGAEPTKITVQYRYRKVVGADYSSKHKDRVMNIPGPVIGIGLSGGFYDNGKGVSPTTAMTSHTKSFNVDGKLSRGMVNSGEFYVNVRFPSNTNKWDGYLRFAFLRVTVEYRTSSYGVSVKKLAGSGFNGDDYTVELSISNKNRTNFNPTLTLVSPLGFSFKRKDKGNGVVSVVNARTFRWNPQLNKGVGSSSVELVFGTSVTFPTGSDSYTGTFSLSESLNGTSNSHIAIIRERPPSEGEETSPEAPPIITPEDNIPVLTEWHKVNIGEKIKPELEVPDNNMIIFGFQVSSDGSIILEDEDTPIKAGYDESEMYLITTYDSSKELHQGTEVIKEYFEDDYWFKCDTIGLFVILMYNPKHSHIPYWEDYLTPTWTTIEGYSEDTPVIAYFFEVRPTEEDLTVPFLTLLSLGDEELDRLGTGYPYIVQSYLKHETDDTNIRDWYKNNRVGVFNNAIEDNITIETVEVDGELVDIVTDSTDYENLTPLDIYENADYWSNGTAGLNDYENVECDFTYNSQYPLYIIITGDYPESLDYGFDDGALTYTEPCIIEKTVYQKWQPNGNYPTPIKNLILNDGSTAETGIPTLNTTDTIIIYDYPLDEDYGNTENRSIRGLEVTGTIEQSDELVLYATLTNPDGIKGQRSVIINDENTTLDNDTRFKLGGLGDLWSFSQNDLHNLEDWELGISIQNLLTDTDTNINFGDIQLTIYTEDLEKQLINVKVNGEDLTFYGAFIENVNIPSGLETDTSFLTIDGTDTNDAYRQNIREKTIELEFTIGGCDLQTSTDMLRQLTKLLVNDKDRYNRPIPNIIEFSHYPDVYFEYIMKDSLDVDSEIGAYNIKAKLTIPSGTAYSKQSTTTNITGFVQGIAAINPIITFKPQTETITITESVSGQVFHMAYAGDWQSKVIEIDCEDRRVYVKEDEDDTTGTDITKYVDFDVDWFSLHGEYAFTGTGCVIRTVNFVERW